MEAFMDLEQAWRTWDGAEGEFGYYANALNADPSFVTYGLRQIMDVLPD